MSRAPEYNRDEVIHKAMQVFWARGYGRTSVTDLVAATGLKPGSLYAAFGNKQGLFVAVLRHYGKRFKSRVQRLTDTERSALGVIRTLLITIADEALHTGHQRGCLAVNSLLELASHEPDIARHLEAHNEEMLQVITQLVERAQADGDIRPERNARALSAFLLNNIWGMQVMCKSRPNRAAMAAIIDGILVSLTAA